MAEYDKFSTHITVHVATTIGSNPLAAIEAPAKDPRPFHSLKPFFFPKSTTPHAMTRDCHYSRSARRSALTLMKPQTGMTTQASRDLPMTRFFHTALSLPPRCH